MPAVPDDYDEDKAQARFVVMRRVAAQIARWPNLHIAPLSTDGLSDRDAGLAQAIYAETIRRWLTLDFLLDTRLRQPMAELEPKLQAALLTGACQLFFFDHLPDHAVVDESVTWASARIRPKAGGLANAVLRRMIELRGEILDSRGHPNSIENDQQSQRGIIPLGDGRWLRLSADDLLPADRIRRLAVQTSHPFNLVEHWSHRYKFGRLEQLLLHNLVSPPTIVFGMPAQVVAEHTALTAHTEPRFAVWQGTHAELESLLSDHPSALVQDPGSAAAVGDTASSLELTGGLIVDYCAGMGTKTAQLAHLYPQANIVATDIDSRRFGLLQQRFEESDQVEVVRPDRMIDFAGRADLLLLDVPCSNSGVLARRIEAKYRLDSENLTELCALQKQIVADSLALLAPTGHLLYTTCSLEPEENQHQQRWIKRWHNKRVVVEGRHDPKGKPGESPAMYADGSYHALLG